MVTLMRNVAWGIRGGLVFASCFSLLAIVSYETGNAKVFAEFGVSLGRLLAWYFTCGLAGGLLVGLLRPFAQGRFEEAGVSALVFALVALSGRLQLLKTVPRPSPKELAFFALLYGTVGFVLSISTRSGRRRLQARIEARRS